MRYKQRMSRRFDTFIFDWDGTLTTGILLRKLNERMNPFWISRKRSSADSTDTYAVNVPKDISAVSGRAIRRHIRKKEMENRLLASLVEMSVRFLKPRLQDGAREALERLDRNGNTIALFTNGAQYRVLKELSYLGVEDYFTAIASAQDVNALKPNPRGLNLIARAVNADKERTVYVGDMVDDMEAAKYAGMHSCAIANGFDSYARLKGTRPDYIFRNIVEFCKAL